MGTLQAMAADMPFYGSDPAPQGPVEFGTGWYIRGDVGGAFDKGPVITPDLSYLADKIQTNWTADVGAGYKFNNWLRGDLTLGTSGTQKAAGTTAVNCYSGIENVVNQTTGNSIGVYAVPDTCIDNQKADLKKQTLLLNAYVDLGTWYGVTPYVGAGVGAARVEQDGSVAYTNASDNSPYRANLVLPTAAISNPTYLQGPALVSAMVPQPVINYGVQNWDRTYRTTKYNFAWSLMAGFSYAMTENASLDIGYRYLNFGQFAGINSTTGTAFSKELSAHQIRIGVRYMVD
jgi:opacity protein-like surface antigen